MSNVFMIWPDKVKLNVKGNQELQNSATDAVSTSSAKQQMFHPSLFVENVYEIILKACHSKRLLNAWKWSLSGGNRKTPKFLLISTQFNILLQTFLSWSSKSNSYHSRNEKTTPFPCWRGKCNTRFSSHTSYLSWAPRAAPV